MSELTAIAGLLLTSVVVIELARWAGSLRRRVRMNRAMHELRRPIQSLALAIEGGDRDVAAAGGWLDQVRDALTELDAQINGRSRSPSFSPLPLGDLAASLERRWRASGVRVDSPPVGPMLVVDAPRLGAALDNLVSNALLHGGGRVRVRALTAPGVARFEVRDGGVGEGPGGADGAAARAGDPRHGHGLRAAAAAASAHGGLLAPPRRSGDGGTVATLTLPAVEPGRGG